MFTVDLGQLEAALIVAGLLLAAGVLASKVSTRLGVPALLLFLGLGMLAGSEGPGGITFDEEVVAQGVGVLALAFILFAGGVDTRWKEVRPVLAGGVVLATVGVAVTAAVTGLIATLVLDVPLAVGLLIGATVSSTDAAAVFSVLRSRSIGLKGRLQPLLELESGSNDPMAILLTIGLIEWITLDGIGPGRAVGFFATQLLLGLGGGLLVALLLAWVLRRVHLEQQGLYPVLTVAAVVLAYAGTAMAGGSGFLAVYVAGLVVGNADVAHKRRLMDFHDAVAWFMQIVLFLVLGLLVFPSRLVQVAVPAVVILAALTLLARPVAVLVCLPRGWSMPERGVVAWVGLRGAASILLATFPLAAGIDAAGIVFDVVFFVVLLSVLVQGTTIPWVARRLRVDAPLGPPEPLAVEAVHEEVSRLQVVELEVGERSPAAGQRIVELDLPERTLIVLLSRGDDRAIPQGTTELQPGDQLLVLTDPSDLDDVRRLLSG